MYVFTVIVVSLVTPPFTIFSAPREVTQKSNKFFITLDYELKKIKKRDITRNYFLMSNNTEQEHKKLKKTMKIGTHSGTFHADEALAVYMLRLLPEYKDSDLLRSRDYTKLEECDIIVDVTGQYDGTKHFDHHQRGFEETFGEEYKTKLSSAGLVYKHFGKQVIANLLEKQVDSDVVEILYPKVYTEFVEAVDANDNGISAYSSEEEPAFKTSAITLPAMVSRLNPLWTEDSSDEALDKRFLQASQLMGEAFVNVVLSYGKGWYPAKSFVETAFAKRTEYDPEGRIVVFDDFVPWKEHLYTIETANDKQGQVLYVLYSDGKGWRVQAVAKSSGSFESRKALPEAWRGKRDGDLDMVTGVPGGVFVHAAGFIGGHTTREGALQLATKALEL